jgi:hypothetical protein
VKPALRGNRECDEELVAVQISPLQANMNTVEHNFQFSRDQQYLFHPVDLLYEHHFSTQSRLMNGFGIGPRLYIDFTKLIV